CRTAASGQIVGVARRARKRFARRGGVVYVRAMWEHDRPDATGLTWRGLSATDDLVDWFALIERIQRHDGLHERVRRQDLARLARQSWVDLTADARVLVDADGVMRAYGHNSFRPAAGDDASVLLLG